MAGRHLAAHRCFAGTRAACVRASSRVPSAGPARPDGGQRDCVPDDWTHRRRTLLHAGAAAQAWRGWASGKRADSFTQHRRHPDGSGTSPVPHRLFGALQGPSQRRRGRDAAHLRSQASIRATIPRSNHGMHHTRGWARQRFRWSLDTSILAARRTSDVAHR